MGSVQVTTYLGVLRIAVLAGLQVAVVDVASFATLRLENTKDDEQTTLVDTRKGNEEGFPKTVRASKAGTAEGGHCTWVDDHWAAAMAVLATEKALTRLPSGRTRSLKHKDQTM